ncbi:DUF3570 domain-containing protein [Tenacibaculum maritimum]|uniref:DUF3570 domain-containing protein n=1 Tax=Tenacibaculum maritimum TaxID=107401 RepID=UPI0003FABC6E|nr:DUF3570 domain-containing protein [Tenacibaculum maritimum]
MQLKIPISIFFILSSLVLSSQNKIKKLDKAQVDILYNYYEQDGNNGAVTGGKGSERLDNSAPQISVSIPVNKVATLGMTLGLDHYTSASTANIDKYGTTTTSASRSNAGKAINNSSSLASEDTRKYGSLNLNRLIPEKNTVVSVLYGHSKEFDVTSNYAKITWQKGSKDNNKFLNISAGIFIDKWLLIYPGEIRAGRNRGKEWGDHDDDDDDDDDDYDKKEIRRGSLSRDDDDDEYYISEESLSENYEKDTRFTYNVGVTYGGNINQRLNASVTAEAIFQKGILNTPFHRVYFNDGIQNEAYKLVKSERLPRSRIKKVLGLRANYFVNSFLITRFLYRFYTDDFGITGHTFELEATLKIGSGFTVYPFYRFHTQTKADYFQPYAMHDLNAVFYTSDYDLSEFSTRKYGIGIRFSPTNGLLSFKINRKKEFQFKTLEFKLSNYSRSTGLEATSVTISNVFTF